MAERRMFAKKIVESDAFCDLDASTQMLYIHLCMEADDDGFVNNPRKIQRMCGASEDDYNILVTKGFLIAFGSGVVVIKHWKMHNYIQADRYKRTDYIEELSLLGIKKNGSYTMDESQMVKRCIQDVSKMDTECIQDVSIGKDRLGKDRLGEDRIGKRRQEDTSHPLIITCG